MSGLKLILGGFAFTLSIVALSTAIDALPNRSSAARPSIVEVTALKRNHPLRLGIGWVIGQRDGTAVVVVDDSLTEGADHLSVIFDHTEKPATILFDAKGRNLAFISSPGLTAPALKLASKTPVVGEAIHAATLTEDKSGRVDSIISEPWYSSEYPSFDEIVFDMGLRPSGVGAPLLDQCGNVLGVTLPRVKVTDNEVDRDMDYAVSVKEVIRIAEEAGVHVSLADAACPASTFSSGH